MARAARLPKTKEQLLQMSLDELNAEIRYLHMREKVAGTSVVQRSFRKEREVVERIREQQYGVASRASGRVQSDSALLTDACAAALRAFYDAPQRGTDASVV